MSLMSPMPIFAIIANLRTIFYQDAETLSAGTENGRPDAYHGAALKYFCHVVCHFYSRLILFVVNAVIL